MPPLERYKTYSAPRKLMCHLACWLAYAYEEGKPHPFLYAIRETFRDYQE